MPAEKALKSGVFILFTQIHVGIPISIHHKKPKGRPMPIAKANATKSKVRARVEHVFAEGKDRMDPEPLASNEPKRPRQYAMKRWLKGWSAPA